LPKRALMPPTVRDVGRGEPANELVSREVREVRAAATLGVSGCVDAVDP
jgi:hypothetical protein